MTNHERILVLKKTAIDLKSMIPLKAKDYKIVLLTMSKPTYLALRGVYNDKIESVALQGYFLSVDPPTYPEKMLIDPSAHPSCSLVGLVLLDTHIAFPVVEDDLGLGIVRINIWDRSKKNWFVGNISEV